MDGCFPDRLKRRRSGASNFPRVLSRPREGETFPMAGPEWIGGQLRAVSDEEGLRELNPFKSPK